MGSSETEGKKSNSFGKHVIRKKEVVNVSMENKTCALGRISH